MPKPRQRVIGRMRIERSTFPDDGLLTAETAPMAPGQRGGASLFVNFARDEMTLLIEVAMDLGMNSGESINQGALGAPLAEEAESSKFYEHSHA